MIEQAQEFGKFSTKDDECVVNKSNAKEISKAIRPFIINKAHPQISEKRKEN